MQTQRPPAITAICIIGFLGPFAMIPLILTGAASQVGSWYPPYLILSAVAGFACMIGLWHMKRWAVEAYAGLALFNQVVMLVMRVWTPLALLIPATIVYFTWKHRAEMR